MSDPIHITPEEREQWRKRLESPFSCHDEDHAEFTLRLLYALEATEDERNELEEYVSKLVYTLTDGKMSKPYDIPVITDEVESSYQEYIREAVAETEDENVRLQKMVDWLAGRCAEHCEDKGPNPRCSVAVCTIIHCNKATAEEWKEAARKSVEGK